MTDVFISYARNDRAFVETLAAALEADGLTVWWDDRIEAGVDFVEAIEQQLEAAQSVVVVWSKASRRSRFVRAEALHALNAGTLRPVSIEGAEPTSFFASVQYQDLSDWSGDPGADSFQTFLAHVRNFSQAAPATPAAPAAEERQGEIDAKTGSTAATAGGGLQRLEAFLAVLAVLVGIGAYFTKIDPVQVIGAYWAGAMVLASGAIALFRAAEGALPQRAKDLVASWIGGQSAFSAAEAFLTMFEALFTRRHWSFGCFFRSAAATLLTYALLLLLFVDFTLFSDRAGELNSFSFNLQGTDWELKRKLEVNAMILLVIIPAVNIFVDYLSLWQTRTILRWSVSWLPLWVGVAVDAVLTAAIFVALLPLSVVIGILISGGLTPAAIEQAIQFTPEVWRAFWAIFEGHPWAEIDSVLAREASLSTTTFLIAFVTTFITSIWLWLAFFLTPFFRLLALGRKGLSWLGRTLEAQARPVAALGYGAAALILLGAGAAQAAQFVFGAVAQEAAKQTFKDCAACPEMVVIPEGSFLMGSPDGEARRGNSEGPQRIVKVQSFALGIYEVTFREWDACVAATRGLEGGCRPIPKIGQNNNGDEGWGRGHRPVITVTWNDAKAYVAWLNGKVEGAPFRLPTEAEWEYAARAGTTTAAWTGASISTSQANFYDGDPDFAGSDRGQTLPVGAFEENPFGLFDVIGNVMEWVEDCEHKNFTGAPVDGSAWMEADEGDCNQAMLRGGSWITAAPTARSAHREPRPRDFKDSAHGFRVAKSLEK